ncbi:MAG: type II toxin-antitoxin system RelE/ParE family toxin [Syntrophobacteraceae bacterium]
MAAYKVLLPDSIEHDVRKIGAKTLNRVMQAVRSLAEDPFPKICKKLKASHSTYRIRVGDYRIVYEVDSAEKTVTIFHIRHRKDVYRQ